MKAKHRRTLCPCVHGIEHHPDRGPCTYGAGTVFGGCRCPAFGTPKSRQPSGPIDPDEAAIDKWVRDVNAALATLANGMKGILLRRREALASGDVDGRVVLRGEPTDTFDIKTASTPATRRAAVTASRRRQEGITYVTTIDKGESGVVMPPTNSTLKPLPTIATLFLTVLAQRVGPLTRKQILLFANRRKSGDVGVAFGRMVREGYVKQVGDRLAITEEGKRYVGPVDPLPSGADLRGQLLEQSDPFTAAVLAELFDIYPEAATRDTLLELTGYRKSGDTGVAFARMVTLGYAVKVGQTALAAAPELFV